jgi:zinc transporter
VGTATVTEDEGLICAFQIAPLSPRTEEVLRDPSGGEGLWLHFNLSNARARRWLQEKAPIPAAARATLLSAETRIHAEILPEGVVAVLTDLDHHFSGDPETFGVIRVYVDDKRLITARRKPLKTVDRLRRELAGGSVELRSPMRLFEHFLEGLAETLGAVVAKLGDEVDDVEERILAGQFVREGKALGRMRRLLAQLRRRMGADRAALARCPCGCRRCSTPRSARVCARPSSAWTPSARISSWCRSAPACCRRRSPVAWARPPTATSSCSPS